MPSRIPMEALALIEYAERYGLLICADGRRNTDDEERLNPDFLYTGQQVREELDSGQSNVFFKADEYHRWQLINPKDVLKQLEQNYQHAQKTCEIAKDYLDRFRETLVTLGTQLKQRT